MSSFNFWFFMITSLAACMFGMKSKNKGFFIMWSVVSVFILLSSIVPPTQHWTDLNNYEHSFASNDSYLPMSLANDWAYYNLMHLLKNMGLTFMEAKAVMMALIVALLYLFCARCSKNVIPFVFFFVLINLLFDLGFLIRYSIAFAVFSHALWYLIDDSEPHGLIKFVIVTILASQFHSALYVFLLFALLKIDFIKAKKYKKLWLALLVFFIAALIWAIRDGTLIEIIGKIVGGLLGSTKYITYTGTARTRYAWLSVLGIWGVTVVSSMYLTSIVNTSGRIQFCRPTKKRWTLNRGILQITTCDIDTRFYVNSLNRIILLSTVYMPLSIFTLHMHRILQYMHFIYLLLMGVLYTGVREDRWLRRAIFSVTFVVTAMWIWFNWNVYKTLSPEMISDILIDHGTWFWLQR